MVSVINEIPLNVSVENQVKLPSVYPVNIESPYPFGVEVLNDNIDVNIIKDDYQKVVIPVILKGLYKPEVDSQYDKVTINFLEYLPSDYNDIDYSLKINIENYKQMYGQNDRIIIYCLDKRFPDQYPFKDVSLLRDYGDPNLTSSYGTIAMLSNTSNSSPILDLKNLSIFNPFKFGILRIKDDLDFSIRPNETYYYYLELNLYYKKIIN